MVKLDSGCVKLIWDAGPEDTDIFDSEYTVQLLSVKKVASNGATPAADRYRVVMSDGVNYLQAMLATPLNPLVEERVIARGTIARVTKMSCNYVQERKLVILLKLESIGLEERIGKPVSVEGGVPLEPEQSASTAAPAGPSTTPAPKSVVKPPPPKPVQPSSSAQPKSNVSVYPIEGLSPYQSNWTIKARVTNKSDLRTYRPGQSNEGKLFNVTLMDDTGEIRGTAFNQVAQDLFNKFEQGKAYYISKAHVNLAKKKFSNVNNDFELTFHKGTEVEECVEQSAIPRIRYSFISLADIANLPKDSVCDVIAVLQEVGPCVDLTTKQARQLKKRDITLVDQSKRSIRLTLWGTQAEKFEIKLGAVLAFKSARVGEYNGKNLSMVSSTVMDEEPDIKETYALNAWYQTEGKTETFETFNDGSGGGGGGGIAFDRKKVRSIDDVKQANLGTEGNEDVFCARATVMHVKPEKLTYEACPAPKCGKKVEYTEGSWKCHKCDASYPQPEHRYIISMAVADYSGQAWLQGFNDVGNVLFGISANELMKLKEEDADGFEEAFDAIDCMTYNFSCRAKQDSFNERVRIRYGISQIKPIDYKEEAQALRDMLYSSWAR